VAALPDTFDGYPGSCGRCYELKCRGIQAVAADGSVDLPRFDACSDESKSIVIKVVDTCPCVGNEKWCCGDVPHFDLGKEAFARLAPVGKGIIGLKWRQVPCEQGMPSLFKDGTVAEAARTDAGALGAAPGVFVGGVIGEGWKKTVYGDAARAMFTYEPSIEKFDDDSVALCADLEQYGGINFDSQLEYPKVFREAVGFEFWVDTSNGVPPLRFRAGHATDDACWAHAELADGATGEKDGVWERFVFSIDTFACAGKFNRLQWENAQPARVAACVKDVRIVLPSVQAFDGEGQGGR
jgi:hypothetical protein